MMRQYEIVAIFPTQYAGEKLEEAKRNVTEQVQKQGGKITGTRELGKRAFGYAIKKQREGVYFVFDLELDPAKVSALKRAFALNEGILRSTIFVAEIKPPQPQKMVATTKV